MSLRRVIISSFRAVRGTPPSAAARAAAPPVAVVPQRRGRQEQTRTCERRARPAGSDPRLISYAHIIPHRCSYIICILHA